MTNLVVKSATPSCTSEKGKPWQSYIETTFNIQRRMADHHFARAQSWTELVAAHDRFVEDYNGQAHWAHRERGDGRRSPQEVLGWVSGVRYRTEELRRAFFSSQFVRVLDSLGYTRFWNWRIYKEEGLAKREAALWLSAESLTVEHGREPLSRYDVKYLPGTGKLRAITRPRLFETSYVLPQLRLFELGEAGWLKALELDEYAPRKPRRLQALQDSLFPFLAGVGGA